MEKHFRAAFILAGILLALSLLVGCSGDNARKVELGEKFTLAPGQSASVAGEQLKIGFVEMTGDSRCPSDVVCIQAGDVKCLVDIAYKGTSRSLTLTQPGLSGSPDTDFEAYRIAFDVQPYPVSTKQIQPEEYRLTLTVNRAGS
ncbi:MAG: hypothetical protein A2Z29_00960 [Chloroflexi bacterium RBG_16_56_11]|nr:MAG: hypothetical protein A2Z29_00960 [Chloroflexi bacterium RBG_16_56_11]